MRFLLFFFILSLSAEAHELLPPAFRLGQEQRARFCLEPRGPADWVQLMRSSMDEPQGTVSLQGQALLVQQNLLVSRAYAALALHAPHPSAQWMGYVYANASHHLGRLVRNSYWDELPEASALAERDRALIRGQVLRTASDVSARTLSTRLMRHSRDLYFTLSWALASASLCGSDSTLKLLDEAQCAQQGRCDFFAPLPQRHYPEILQLLKNALAHWNEPASFAQHFLVFEQTYLQRTMYQDTLIASSARLGVLDKMRFISFNGEEQTAFYEWCRETRCGHTSLDLSARIKFDQWAVAQEWPLTLAENTLMQERLKNTELSTIAETLQQHFCRLARGCND